MKAALLCFVTLTSMVTAAPTLSYGKLHRPVIPQSHIRHKRSSYGGYGTPCGAGTGPIPAVAPGPYQLSLGPAMHPMHPSLSPHAGYAQHGYGYGLPQYRGVAEEQEMMSFSDMEPFMSEQMPMARYAYAPAPVSHYAAPAGYGLGGHLAPSSVSSGGSVIGVFPNSNVGGCSVPLLLSCSPNVSQGKIIKQHPQAAEAGPAIAIAPEAYRGVEEQAHHQMHEQEEHQTHEMHTPEDNHSHAMSQ